LEYQIHKEWSQCFASICTDEIKILNDTIDWQVRSNCIQINHMSVADLPSLAIPELIDDYHHPYEKTLGIIKLPLPIPFLLDTLSSDTLFIRPDNYAIFRDLHNKNKTILLGYPGIFKSWFQWKFILYWCRPDIYMDLHPIISNVNEENSRTPVAKPLKVEDLVLEDCMETLLNCNRPVQIVRALYGQESYMFKDNTLYYRKHDPVDLKMFTNEKDVILWEPSESKNPVTYDGVTARIIATVSSTNINQY
jgi:hypothetical protein